MTAICTAAVNAALANFERYGGADGPDPEKAMRYAILAAQAEQERHEADERAHARRRDDPLLLHESEVILGLAEARKKAHEYVSADGDSVRAGRAMQAQGTRHS